MIRLENLNTEAEIIKKIIPEYDVIVNKKGDGVRCRSVIGMSEYNGDHAWEVFKNSLKYIFNDRINDRINEFYQNTWTNHLDFTVFINRGEIINTKDCPACSSEDIDEMTIGNFMCERCDHQWTKADNNVDQQKID